MDQWSIVEITLSYVKVLDKCNITLIDIPAAETDLYPHPFK